VTDSGDGEEGGGDELPCATEGEGGEDIYVKDKGLPYSSPSVGARWA